MTHSSIPDALTAFCDPDTDPGQNTMIGPLQQPRAPALVLLRAKRTHRVTIPPRRMQREPGYLPPEWGMPEISIEVEW